MRGGAGGAFLTEDGCLGGFYSMEAGVLSCWSVYDLFVLSWSLLILGASYRLFSSGIK